MQVAGRELKLAIAKPSEDAKIFWLMMYAIEAFREVIWACNYLLQSRPHPSDSMFRSIKTLVSAV